MNSRSKAPPSFAALVQAWFAESLTQQRALSAHTIVAYRDSFVLFLEFAGASLGKSPAMMTLADMTPELIMGFLEHLASGTIAFAVAMRDSRHFARS